MSIPTSFKGLRVNVDRGGKIGNKTQIQFPQPEDDNANQLSLIGDQEGLIEGYSTSSIPPLVSQSESPDKLVIWSSDQQCMEPEVREIELLECQEIHTFSENRDKEEGNEEDNDEGSLKDGKDEGLMSISSSSTASSASIGIRRNDSNKVEGRIQKGNEVQKRSACHSIEELDTCVTGSIEKRGMRSGKESWKGGLKESKSETNVFVSSLSTISLSGSLSSALDSREVAQSLISLSNPETNPYPTANNSTSAQTRRRTAPVDGNQNSPPLHPREKYDCPQYCSQDPRQEEGSHHTNGLSSDGGLGQRRKAGFEEKVLPPRRQQLVRPLCQTEMGRARNLAESGAHQVEIGQSTSLNLSPDSHNNGSSRKFTKSSLREPSDFSHLYNTSAVTQPRQSNQTAQREASPVEKHLAANARWSSSPSNPSILEKRPQTQLTYKRNCSSSNRTGVESKSSTPPHSPLRTPQGSPRRQTSMYFVSRNVSGVVRHIPSGCNPAVTSAQGYGNSCLRAPVKTNISTSGIPKAPLNNQQSSTNSNHSSSPKESSSSPTLKPKGVRPKIITYLRKNPQFKPKAADEPYQVSSLPSRLSAYTHGQAPTSFKDTTKDLPKPDAETRGVPVLIASSLFCDKPEAAAGPWPLAEGCGGGAVTRTATGPAKGRGPSQGQRSTLVFSQPILPVSPATSQKSQDKTDDQVFTHYAPAPPPPASATAAVQLQAAGSRSLLPKTSQSGLRPPSFSSSRLAAFGFVRSSSVSSVSSVQSADSTQSDPCRTAHRLSVSEEPPLHRVTTGPPSTDHQRVAPCRSNSLQPPSTPALPRRYLPPQPRSSPGVGRKEFQRSSEVTRSLPSSPKRLAVVPPKPQSPVQSGQRSAAAVRGSAPPGSPRRVAPLRLQQEQQENLQREKEEAQQKERERQAQEREKKKEEQREEVQRLQSRCEQQERQLRVLREELRKTLLGLEAFIITTQHYCLKNKTADENHKKLSLEIQKLRQEMVSSSVQWERLQQEKTALEVAFERELQELQLQQETELAAVEEGLRKCHLAETEHLKAEHRSEMEELRTQQQEQVEEITGTHQAAIQELRDMHNITMATLHEEHARTMRDLRKAHDQQKMLLEEDFDKLRLSLQDQVDTLTFQNQSLRDKAKRFEEALRRSTDEQIIDALAPYQHIVQDLESLKEVVEMKNQQIHRQEKKISDLEKVAQKNVFLEEKVQVLQQQNEDLKARIEMKLALSRQLSEENANLQESVEKESTEKKRLSRNNEELLWRLQTSPLMSPASSPLHRSFSSSPVPSSPFFSSSPTTGCDSPTHCHSCPQQVQYSSPSHRVAANQNLSPGPATPTHRAASNQNYSPGPATPTHRASANRCNSVTCFSSLQR
uniref:microtubule-associated tumor suppressor candidate 2 homolog n=1 Tax=Monopterus albus TaxID=43700 RepID=UPI0009B2F75F|nr:microtubule-associated tumor suppressor candidate 2 homolog [Monopterus albus]